jgi:hypothetical protein
MDTRNLWNCSATILSTALLILISCVVVSAQSISKPPKGFRVVQSWLHLQK